MAPVDQPEQGRGESDLDVVAVCAAQHVERPGGLSAPGEVAACRSPDSALPDHPRAFAARLHAVEGDLVLEGVHRFPRAASAASLKRSRACLRSDAARQPLKARHPCLPANSPNDCLTHGITNLEAVHRAQHDVPSSITSSRMCIGALLARSLPRCPCCLRQWNRGIS